MTVVLRVYLKEPSSLQFATSGELKNLIDSIFGCVADKLKSLVTPTWAASYLVEQL
jgi:hypothetical protein